MYNKYRNSVKVVSMWLESTNEKFDQLPDIARELDVLKNQLEQMKVRLNKKLVQDASQSWAILVLILKMLKFVLTKRNQFKSLNLNILQNNCQKHNLKLKIAKEIKDRNCPPKNVLP